MNKEWTHKDDREFQDAIAAAGYAFRSDYDNQHWSQRSIIKAECPYIANHCNSARCPKHNPEVIDL